MGEKLKFYRLMLSPYQDLTKPGPRECAHIIFEDLSSAAIKSLAKCQLCDSQFHVLEEDERGLTIEQHRIKRLKKYHQQREENKSRMGPWGLRQY